MHQLDLPTPFEIKEDIGKLEEEKNRIQMLFRTCFNHMKIINKPKFFHNMKARAKQESFSDLYKENIKQRIQLKILNEFIDKQSIFIEYLFKKEENLLLHYSLAKIINNKLEKEKLRTFVAQYINNELREHRSFTIPSKESLGPLVKNTMENFFSDFSISNDIKRLEFKFFQNKTKRNDNEYDYHLRNLIFEQHEESKKQESKRQTFKKIIVDRSTQCSFESPKLQKYKTRCKEYEEEIDIFDTKIEKMKDRFAMKLKNVQKANEKEQSKLKEHLKMDLFNYKQQFLKNQDEDFIEKNQIIRDLKLKLSKFIKKSKMNEIQIKMMKKNIDHLQRTIKSQKEKMNGLPSSYLLDENEKKRRRPFSSLPDVRNCRLYNKKKSNLFLEKEGSGNPFLLNVGNGEKKKKRRHTLKLVLSPSKPIPTHYQSKIQNKRRNSVSNCAHFEKVSEKNSFLKAWNFSVKFKLPK